MKKRLTLPSGGRTPIWIILGLTAILLFTAWGLNYLLENGL